MNCSENQDVGVIDNAQIERGLDRINKIIAGNNCTMDTCGKVEWSIAHLRDVLLAMKESVTTSTDGEPAYTHIDPCVLGVNTFLKGQEPVKDERLEPLDRKEVYELMKIFSVINIPLTEAICQKFGVAKQTLEPLDRNIKETLIDWLKFSSDVKPNCAAGQDQLLYLESRTKALLNTERPQQRSLSVQDIKDAIITCEDGDLLHKNEIHNIAKAIHAAQNKGAE